MKTKQMKVYYIAYDFGLSFEMIDGPFGTYSEANAEREALCNGTNDERLVLVQEFKEVSTV